LEGGGSESNFSEGRAVRELTLAKPFFAAASSSWISKDWSVFPNECNNKSATVQDMDPRVWIGSPLVLYINKLSDPKDNKNNRFIELYSPNRKDHVITADDFASKRIEGRLLSPSRCLPETPKTCCPGPCVVSKTKGKGGRLLEDSASAEPSSDLLSETAFSLVGFTIDKYGYLVICKNETEIPGRNGGNWDGQCGGFLGSDELDTMSKDNLSMIMFDEFPFRVLDIYSKDYTDGLATRIEGNCPMPVFNPEYWEIKQNVSSAEMNPAGSGCNLIITELASPEDNTDARYVELYSDNCSGKSIGYNFKLVVVVAGSNIPEEGIDLKGMAIRPDGFLVLCSTAEANDAYDNKCDYIVGRGTAVDNDGTKSIAIVLTVLDGKVDVIEEIYDIYGEHCLYFDSVMILCFDKYLTL